ncbi:MAG: hypothetical protein Q7V88_11115 [Actinomycetota bacterium]|nr:hypothetical protein [Actinomycetota bacterium]
MEQSGTHDQQRWKPKEPTPRGTGADATPEVGGTIGTATTGTTTTGTTTAGTTTTGTAGVVATLSPAPPLLTEATVRLSALLLDPGDELAVADEADGDEAEGAAFMRAFTPMRAYQRLCAAPLNGLMSAIAQNPSALAGRILVRGYGEATGNDARYVVIDGSWHVAALRRLQEEGSVGGIGLSADVRSLFGACPVTVVCPGTDPALVLALSADAAGNDDPWLYGQRDRLLHQLASEGFHHSPPSIAAATRRDAQVTRRYQAYRALQQMMQLQDVPLHAAVRLYPLFYAALGRTAIRAWLDWDDTLSVFIDDDALEHFHRLLAPGVRADGTTRPPCIAGSDDVVRLCDVLGEPAARKLLLAGATLAEADEVINAGAFQQLTTQVSEAIEAMRWDRRRFGSRG